MGLVSEFVRRQPTSSFDVASTSSALVQGNAVDGVRLGLLQPALDERGVFTEMFAEHWDCGVDAVQWSIVQSRAGVLRGMHLHARHDEYLAIVSGRMFVGLHDLRPASPTFRVSCLYHLTAADPAYISWPRGLLHGWLYPEATVHLQGTSEAYATYGVDDNEGCHWSDPDLGIDWPFAPSVVSARAESFGSVDALLARVRARSRT
jgi:dTDP-4-dehydrorhamnose 3,5-epimerase